MKKQLLIISIFTFVFSNLGSTIMANKSYLGLNAGYVSFDKDFKGTYGLGAKFGLLNRDGLGFDFSATYMNAELDDNSGNDVAIIPISIGVNYVFNPERKITPYFGGFVAYNLLNNNYESNIGFGGRVGMLINLDPSMSMYFEGAYHSIDTTLAQGNTKTDVTMSPLYISYGITMTLGKPFKGYGAKKDVRKKRNIQKRQRRNRAGKRPRLY